MISGLELGDPLSRYACLLVACCLLVLVACSCFSACPTTWRAAKRKDKSWNSWKTEIGLVQETQARWKDRPNVPGGFFFEGDIPSLEGSNSRKVIQKQPISPRGRVAVAPGPPPGNFARISEQRSLLISSVLG